MEFTEALPEPKYKLGQILYGSHITEDGQTDEYYIKDITITQDSYGRFTGYEYTIVDDIRYKTRPSTVIEENIDTVYFIDRDSVNRAFIKKLEDNIKRDTDEIQKKIDKLAKLKKALL